MSALRPADIVLDPSRAKEVAGADLPKFISAIVTLRERADVAYAALSARLPVVWNGAGEPITPGGDRLLSIKQAAEKLGRSTDFLYRHADKLPFTVRSGRSLQFSERGIEQWIKSRQRGGTKR